jgi:chromosome segregation ATPase
LAAVGLVPARRYAALSRRAEESGREARMWRKRAGKAAARRETLERQLHQQIRLLKETRAAAARTSAATDRQNREWKAMQARLADAERALAIAREQLMAIEVKLDILEGAANVLDARTRAATQRQPDKTSATV